jgi:predicted kinase
MGAAAPSLTIFSGPPGCGKSTLADALARRTGARVFNWDWIMSGIRIHAEAWEPIDTAPELRRDVGYSIMSRMIEHGFRIGQSAITDCIVRPRAFEQWCELAREYDAEVRVVEVSCSDPAVHESRVVGRERLIPGWDELDWAFVQVSRSIYEPLPKPKLVLDAVDPLERNLARLFAYLDP